MFSELGSRRAKPATAESYPPAGYPVGRQCLVYWVLYWVQMWAQHLLKWASAVTLKALGVSQTEVIVGDVALAGTDAKACLACIRGGQNRRSPAVLRSALEPRGCDDGLDYLYWSTSKHSESSTVRLHRDQTAPAIARAARARAWGKSEHGWGRNSRRKTDSRSPGGAENKHIL